MGGLIALVVSVAALDSLNPSTLAPALVLAVGRRPRRAVAAFTLGVFGVSLLGGLVLLFGPGRALLAHIAKPSPHTRHLIEAIAGALLVAVALVLLLARDRVRRRLSKSPSAEGRSALLLGAGIMAVELPTAFPYFAGILATVEATHSIAAQVALVLLYNALFVAPLLGVLVLVTFTGAAAEDAAARLRQLLVRYAPTVVPGGLACLGVGLLVVGATRL